MFRSRFALLGYIFNGLGIRQRMWRWCDKNRMYAIAHFARDAHPESPRPAIHAHR
jgi:hypothetical protein